MKDERWSLWVKVLIIALFVVGITIVATSIRTKLETSIVSLVKVVNDFNFNILTKETLWLGVKIVVFFFTFVFLCHGPLVWIGFLFSIEDGKAKTIYAKDRILNIKITYYGRHLDEHGNVVEDEKNNFPKPFKWFKNYFFGSLHILGIPGIHNVDKEEYLWEKLNPVTGKAEPTKGIKGEFPLKEFIPIINFENLDIVGGQINVKIGPLVRITNPIKAATVARDWFPFLIDMTRGHIKECFAPLDFFRVMINKIKFGQTDMNGESIEDDAGDLSDEIFEYFEGIKVTDKINGIPKEIPLIEFIEWKYGIKIKKFYVMDPDPANTSSKELLDSTAKPGKAKLDGKSLVINAAAEADAFSKEREAMEKPGGRRLRELQALERSSLVTLGGDWKDLNIFVDTNKQKKGEV